MARDLEVLSAGWEMNVGGPMTVTLNIVSRDLKARPVHRLRLTQPQALKLARQLIASIEAVEELLEADR